MSDIILYGAFDRHNYGDLLFPLVMQRLLSKEFPQETIVIAGLIRSDLSQYGALPTVGIKQALYKSTDPILILAGGDVVACDWLSAYGYLLPSYLFSIFDRYVCRFAPHLTENVVKRLVGLQSFMPFSPNKTDIGCNAKLIYNSVGATAVSGIQGINEEELAKAINEADFVTVRDHFSHDQMKRIKAKVDDIYPDSATVMSSLFSNEEIDNKTHIKTHGLIEKLNSNYLIFQISSAHCNGLEKEFAENLSIIAQKHNVAILFLAIGNAAGHSDYQGIERIKRHLDNGVNIFEYVDGGIFDIMNLIRHSACYCGTSLHGLITSMSFHVPRVGLLPKLRKQQNYMAAWDLDEMPRGILPQELSTAVNTAMAISKEKIISVEKNVTAKYLESFKLLCKVI